MRVGKSNQARSRVLKSSVKRQGFHGAQRSFLNTLSDYEIGEGQLEVYIEKIDEYARKLLQTPTFENLRRYKEAVRLFLQQVINRSYTVEENVCIDPHGRRRVFILVKNIDTKLEELTQLFMQRHQGTLDLAQRLDEIRGLLLDLYS